MRWHFDLFWNMFQEFRRRGRKCSPFVDSLLTSPSISVWSTYTAALQGLTQAECGGACLWSDGRHAKRAFLYLGTTCPGWRRETSKLFLLIGRQHFDIGKAAGNLTGRVSILKTIELADLLYILNFLYFCLEFNKRHLLQYQKNMLRYGSSPRLSVLFT